MQKRTNQAVFAILAMITFWLVINTVKLNTLVPDYTILNKTVNVLMDRVIAAEELLKDVKSLKGDIGYEKLYEEQNKYLNEIAGDSDFESKFREMREKYGNKYLFVWNGKVYTTHWAEEVNNNKND